GGVGRGAGSRGRSGGRRLHSRPFAALRAALGGGRRGGGDANSALRASDMRRLGSPATPSASALVKLATPTPAPRPETWVRLDGGTLWGFSVLSLSAAPVRGRRSGRRGPRCPPIFAAGRAGSGCRGPRSGRGAR